MNDTQHETRCVIYESRRLLKWSWRIKFIAPNNKKLGHQYNNIRDALLAVDAITNPAVPLRLIAIDRTGRPDDRGIIRG